MARRSSPSRGGHWRAVSLAAIGFVSILVCYGTWSSSQILDGAPGSESQGRDLERRSSDSKTLGHPDGMQPATPVEALVRHPDKIQSATPVEALEVTSQANEASKVEDQAAAALPPPSADIKSKKKKQEKADAKTTVNSDLPPVQNEGGPRTLQCDLISVEKVRKKCEEHQKTLETPLAKYPEDLALVPGKAGKCFFHSQKDWIQDQYVFQKLGGKVDAGSCQKKKWIRFTPFDDHTVMCKCTAPEKGAFNRHFMEIGAADGIYLSNTLFFESQMGWTGLCIEGSPTSYALLRQNRPNCVSVNAVIGDPEKIGAAKTFYSFDQDLAADGGNVGGWQIGMSCMEGFSNCRTPADARRFAKSYKRNYTTSSVAVSRMQDLFRQHNMEDMAYMSIDVEGAEKIVLRTIDFSRLTGKCLANIEGHDKAVIGIMKNGGFKELTDPKAPKVDAWFERGR